VECTATRVHRFVATAEEQEQEYRAAGNRRSWQRIRQKRAALDLTAWRARGSTTLNIFQVLHARTRRSWRNLALLICTTARS
jgi:hypothetical protein